jgi:SAM-dependent methyltransferase
MHGEINLIENLDAVTYQRFGIDPQGFYAERFNDGGQAMPAPCDFPPHIQRSISFQKFDFLVEAIAKADRPARVLDIGCGSGRYGKVVKHHFPGTTIVGVDMSESCTETTLLNGYDEAVTHDFNSGLPFADNDFDFVFSCDTFGHVEFRHKNRLISEIRRVTRIGGEGFHGIEAGFIDYLGANPEDPNDKVRRYIGIDGHIGVETLDQNFDRFSRFLRVTSAFNWLVRPALETANALNHNQWGEDFSADVAAVRGPEALALCDAVIGVFNQRNLDMLFQAFGPILTQRHLRSVIPEGPLRNYILAMADWGGFAMIRTRKT